MQSLKTIRKQASGKGAPQVLDHMIERVEAGEPLYKAAIDYGPPFDDLVIGMLRAAEASGRTPEILHQLAELLDRGIELRREVMGALNHLVALLIIAGVVILVTVVIPRVMEPTRRQRRRTIAAHPDRPRAGQLHRQLVVFACSASSSMCAWMRIAVPLNRLRYDRFKLRIPPNGRLAGMSLSPVHPDPALTSLDCRSGTLRITRDTPATGR